MCLLPPPPSLVTLFWLTGKPENCPSPYFHFAASNCQDSKSLKVGLERQDQELCSHTSDWLQFNVSSWYGEWQKGEGGYLVSIGTRGSLACKSVADKWVNLDLGLSLPRWNCYSYRLQIISFRDSLWELWQAVVPLLDSEERLHFSRNLASWDGLL